MRSAFCEIRQAQSLLGDALVFGFRTPSQTCCKLVLQLFNRVRPLEWLGGLIVVSHKIQDGPLKLQAARKMVRLEKLALEQREPDLNLIKPRSVGWKPIELHRQFPFRSGCQFGNPSWELLSTAFH